MESARRRFPELWMPNRSDLCFATTNRQAALKAIAGSADAVVVIGSANSSNTVALEKVARAAGCPRVVRVNRADELPDDLDRHGGGHRRGLGPRGAGGGGRSPAWPPGWGWSRPRSPPRTSTSPRPPSCANCSGPSAAALGRAGRAPRPAAGDPVGDDRAVSAADVLEALAS